MPQFDPDAFIAKRRGQQGQVQPAAPAAAPPSPGGFDPDAFIAKRRETAAPTTPAVSAPASASAPKKGRSSLSPLDEDLFQYDFVRSARRSGLNDNPDAPEYQGMNFRDVYTSQGAQGLEESLKTKQRPQVMLRRPQPSTQAAPVSKTRGPVRQPAPSFNQTDGVDALLRGAGIAPAPAAPPARPGPLRQPTAPSKFGRPDPIDELLAKVDEPVDPASRARVEAEQIIFGTTGRPTATEDLRNRVVGTLYKGISNIPERLAAAADFLAPLGAASAGPGATPYIVGDVQRLERAGVPSKQAFKIAQDEQQKRIQQAQQNPLAPTVRAKVTTPAEEAIGQLLPTDPRVTSATGLEGFVRRDIPEAVGSLLEFAATGAVGKALGAPRAFAGLYGALQNAQQAAREYDQSGRGDGSGRQLTYAVGALIGSLEALGLGKTLERFGGKAGLTKRLLEAGEEGLQEYASQVLNDVNAGYIGGYDPSRAQGFGILATPEAGKAATLGLLLGGGVQGLDFAADRVRTSAAEEAIRAEPVQPPQMIAPAAPQTTQVVKIPQGAPAPESQPQPAPTAPTVQPQPASAAPIPTPASQASAMADPAFEAEFSRLSASGGKPKERTTAIAALRSQPQFAAIAEDIQNTPETERAALLQALPKDLGEALMQPLPQPGAPAAEAAPAEKPQTRRAQAEATKAENLTTAMQLADEAAARSAQFAAEGNTQEAVAELRRQQAAIKDAIRNAPNTPEGLKTRDKLRGQLSQVGNQIGQMRRSPRTRSAAAQEVAPPAPARSSPETRPAQTETPAPAAETPAEPAQQPVGRTVKVSGEDVELTPEQSARWMAEVVEPLQRAKENYEREIAIARNQRAQGQETAAASRETQAANAYKAAGIKISAVKREIAGRLTPNERAAKERREASNFVGKPVSVTVDGQPANGKVSGTSFGRVQVQLDDGRRMTVEREAIGAPVENRQFDAEEAIARPEPPPLEERFEAPTEEPEIPAGLEPEVSEEQVPTRGEQRIAERRPAMAQAAAQGQVSGQARAAESSQLPPAAAESPAPAQNLVQPPQRPTRPTERRPIPQITPENYDEVQARLDQLSRLEANRRGETDPDLRDELSELRSAVIEYENRINPDRPGIQRMERARADAMPTSAIAISPERMRQAVEEAEARVMAEFEREDLEEREQEALDRGVRAIDAIFDDSDMRDLLERGVEGDNEAASYFISVAEANYGIDRQTAESLVESRRTDREQRTRDTRRRAAESRGPAVETGDETVAAGVPAQRPAQEVPRRAREITEDDLALLSRNPAEVADQDFDAYLSSLEDLQNQNRRGQVELPDWMEREVEARIRQANGIRKDLVKRKRLARKFEPPPAPKKLTKKELAEDMKRSIEEREGQAQRTVSHPDPAIDGKPVIAERADGRVIVANAENDTGISIVKDRGEEIREKAAEPSRYKLEAGFKTAEQVSEALGRELSLDDIGDLVGAADGTKIRLQNGIDRNGRDMIRVDVFGKGIGNQKREISVDQNGKLVIYNDQLQKTPDAPAGFMSRALDQQIEAGKRLGVDRIEAFAAGGYKKLYNGYYTLPRLGFDGPLPDSLDRIPPGLRKAKTIQELLALPDGPEWWKRNGKAMYVSLDIEQAAKAKAARDASKPKAVVQAERRLNEYLTGKRSGSGAQQFADMALVAGYRLYKAGMQFGEWARDMMAIAGDRVAPYLRQTWRTLVDAAPAKRTGVESKSQRTTTAALKSAGRETLRGLNQAAKGLSELFGGPKLSSGITFDEQTYAKAKPYFQEAYTHLKTALGDLGDAYKALVETLQNRYGFTDQDLDRMEPYIRKYVDEQQPNSPEAIRARLEAIDAEYAGLEERYRATTDGSPEEARLENQMAQLEAEGERLNAVLDRAAEAREERLNKAAEERANLEERADSLDADHDALEEFVGSDYGRLDPNDLETAEAKSAWATAKDKAINYLNEWSAKEIETRQAELEAIRKESKPLEAEYDSLEAELRQIDDRLEEDGDEKLEARRDEILERQGELEEKFPGFEEREGTLEADIAAIKADTKQSLKDLKANQHPAPENVDPDLDYEGEDASVFTAPLRQVYKFFDEAVESVNKERARARQEADAKADEIALDDIPEGASYAEEWKRLNARFSKEGRLSPEDSKTYKALERKITQNPNETTKPKFVSEAEARLKEVSSGKRAGSGAQALADQAIVTGYRVYRAGMKFAEWARAAIREAGQQVKPHLRDAWQKLQAGTREFIRDEEGSAVASPGPSKRAGQAAQPKPTPAASGRQPKSPLFAKLQEKAQPKKATLLEKASTFRKAGFLGGIPTHLRNIGANAIFQLAEEGARGPGALADLLVSTVTGRRELTGPNLPAIVRAGQDGATKGLAEARRILRSGQDVDEAANSQRTEVKYKNPILQAYTQAIFRSLSAEDALFRSYALRRALEGRARAQAINEVREKKIAKDQLRARTQELVNDPPADLSAGAVEDSLVAVFQNENRLSSAISKGKQELGPGGRFLADLFMPYDKTPTNIIARTLEYSPAGFVKNLGQAAGAGRRAIAEVREQRRTGKTAGRSKREIARDVIDKAITPDQQKAFSEVFGRATIGTGLLYLGAILAEKGLLTGFYGDPEEEKRNQAAGKQPGAILDPMTGRSYAIAGLGPVGLMLVTGATIQRERTRPLEDESKRTERIVRGAGQVLTDVPFLQGAKQAEELISKPGSIGAKAGRLAAGFIPTVGNVGKLTDPYEREGGTFLSEVGKQIPGVRRLLPEKKDAQGRPIETEYSDLVDPFNSRPVRETPLLREMERLGMGFGKSKKDEGEPDDLFQARTDRAQHWFEQYGGALVESPRFAVLSKDQQKAAIQSVKKRVTTQANEQEPNLEGLDPETIIDRMLAAPERKRARDERKIYAPRAQ